MAKGHYEREQERLMRYGLSWKRKN
nr:unnamed protein product [Callosobruchus chinensis]